MHRYSANPFITFLFLLIFCLSFPGFACADTQVESDEDMACLELYFDEADLVETPARFPKSITQIAENFTVVTAKKIEAMNAHTVGEVINRVAGVFNPFYREFGSSSIVRIQGSDDIHVLVLVNGVPWNTVSSGTANTRTVPVGIIDRIEIIKGPASSAWGSSLGGVINILTKKPGKKAFPSGKVTFTHGEKNTSDMNAEVTGRVGAAGYYLYAGKQDSDGFLNSRKSDNHSLYSRFNLPVSKKTDLILSMGYSEPRNDAGFEPWVSLNSHVTHRVFWASAGLDARIREGLGLNISLHRLDKKTVQKNDENGLYAPAGDLYQDNIWDEGTRGASARVGWKHGQHTTVAGIDYQRGRLEQTRYSGDYLQWLGALPIAKTDPGQESWAVYINDTFSWNRLTLTPGIRYDHDSITGSFTSPSLGITYMISGHTLLRGLAAKGFTTPPLSFTSGGGAFFDPNPDLDPEEIVSYQAGVESTAIRQVLLKASFFQHDVTKSLDYVISPNTGNEITINSGRIRRRGMELEAETIPFYNISFKAGLSCVRIADFETQERDKQYSANLGIFYNHNTWEAQLFGHYLWDDRTRVLQDDFIWDLTITKNIFSSHGADIDLIVSVRNIFNGGQCYSSFYPDPERWIEGGVRITF